MSSQDMRQMTGLGRKIETGSFAVIDAEVGPHSFDEAHWQVVRRVIHATADFEFKELMEFHPDGLAAGIAALRRGAPVIADVNMILAGLNAVRLEHYGCRTHCFISDEDVIRDAKAANSTRAIESIRKAQRLNLLDGAIVAVGNAPTALLEVCRLARAGIARPALVIGVPVGFISADESKDELATMADLPWIISRGRKGGTTIAVSIIHALMALGAEET